MDIKVVDKINNTIIELLIDNARMSLTEIGEIVGLSRTAVKNRIKALEDNELISGYKAIINTKKILPSIIFIMHIETNTENFEAIKDKLKEKRETITILQTTGKYNLTAICSVGCIEDMTYFISKFSKETQGILALKYNAILDIVKGNLLPLN